jgi:tetratricopeptide (TPR) repeat protein
MASKQTLSPLIRRCAPRRFYGNFDSNTLMYKHYPLSASFFLAALLFTPGSALGQVTFTKDVAPIVFSQCGQCHHPGGTAPFSLLGYQSARQHATQMAMLTKNRLMPPWNAQSDYGPFIGLHPLTDAQIDVIQRWVAAGAPEGSGRDLPPVPRWESGWQLGKPDLIVTFPQPYLLPAEGPDISRVFVLPLPVSRLRYVRGIEFHPGNGRVHHANIRIDPTPASLQLDEADPAPGYDGIILRSAVYPDGHFLGWTPGQAAPLLPKGLAWRLEPNSDLVVQLHMVPSGKQETIQPSIALYFTDDAPERTPTMLRLSVQDISIDAGNASYSIADSYVLPADVDLLALQPHAHYLAHDVKGFATLPDGTTRTLIAIADWDLRWQHVYRLEVPVPLPKGTTVSMRYTYDNSVGNPRNPSRPPKHVDWGQRSQEEMGDLWLQMLTRSERDRTMLQAAVERKMIAADVIGDEELIRREPARTALRDDIAVLYLALGRPEDALRHFEASAQLKPESAPAHFNLGTTLAAVGRLDEAIAQYRQALQLRPSYALAHNNLGAALTQLHRLEEAAGEFRDAVRLEPGLSEAHLNLGNYLRLLGSLGEAVAEFRAAVRTQPASVSALAGLASLLATAPDASIRKPEEAVKLAENAAELTSRREANALDVLAAAYAASGDFDRALSVSQEALGLNPPAPVAAGIRLRQDLYRRQQPYISK